MARLYLVGFTTDLKNLVFATRRGAKSGSYLVAIDGRLRRTLQEVDKLDSKSESEAQSRKLRQQARSSRLTPKEIQSKLRAGKSPEEVAKLADTDVAWIERFISPIIAEMAGVVEAVKVRTISKPRLGASTAPVGEAIAINLVSKKVSVPPEVLDEGWRAIRRDGHWEVSLRYMSRGRRKVATFSFDPETKEVHAMNSLAAEIGWLGPGSSNSSRSRSPARSRAKPKSRTRSTRRSA